MNLWAQESWVAVHPKELPDGSIDDQGLRMGDGDVYETAFGNPGDLFRSCQVEFGRCVSKVYVGNDARQIGWVFEKKTRDADTGEPFIMQTWVTVHKRAPTQTVEYHYAEL